MPTLLADTFLLPALPRKTWFTLSDALHKPCVFSTRNGFFHPSTSSTTSVPADVSKLSETAVRRAYHFFDNMVDTHCVRDQGGSVYETKGVSPYMRWLRFIGLGLRLGHFLCSRIPPVENGPFRLDFFSTRFSWSFFSVVSRVDFLVFVLFLEAVGMREYCCTAVEIGWQLCAPRFLREQRLGEPSSQRVGGFGLSRKPPKLRSWSCTQPRATKATAAAAVVGSMGSRPRAAAVV